MCDAHFGQDILRNSDPILLGVRDEVRGFLVLMRRRLLHGRRLGAGLQKRGLVLHHHELAEHVLP